jgi:predicted Zn-dependent protease
MSAATADPLAALARRADPADAGAQNNLGVVLARHGRQADARRAFARALALDPGMALARRNLDAAGDGPEHAAEERALCARVRAAPSDPEAWRALVRHLSARGAHDEARAVLTRWAAAAPDDAAPAAERARAELAAGRPESALDAVAHARALAPAGPLLHAALDVLAARAAYQRGDAPAALALLDQARRTAPDDADAALLRSFVLGETGAASAAAAARAHAAALNPALGIADENLALAPEAGLAAAPPPALAPAPVHEAAPDPAAVLALARAHRHKGYLDEAAAVLARARAGGDNVALAREAGEVLLLAGRPAEAAEAWGAARALGADDPATWLNLGVAQALGGQAGAGEAFDRVAERARGTCAAAWALAGTAHVARSAGDWPRACEALRAAAGATREAAPVPRAVIATLFARALAALGRHAEARRAAAAAERLAPAWAHAAAVHGELLAAAGAHAEARQAFARAVAIAPEDAACRYGLAFAASACGDHEAARAETARALALAPIVPALPWPLVADVGEWLVCGVDAPASQGAPPLTAGDAQLADARLAALFGEHVGSSAADPSPADARAVACDAVAVRAAPYADADALLAVGEYDRAVGALSRAMARGADRAAGLARTALAFERQGYAGEALERYTEALAAGGAPSSAAAAPDAADPARGRARMLVALGRWGEARSAAEDAVRRTPDDPRAHALVACAAARGGEDEPAAAAARRAEAIAANAAPGGRAAGAESWAAVAAAWRALDDPAREHAAWERALAVAPGDTGARLARADALVRAGHSEAARDALQALVRERPEASDAALALARVAAAAGEAAEAARLLAAVVARDPWHTDALAGLALALVDAGRPDEAAHAAERALRLDREHALAHAAAAVVAAARHAPPRAAAHARAALRLEPAGEGARRARAVLARVADGLAGGLEPEGQVDG